MSLPSFCWGEGHNVEVRVTYESGDSERIAEEALGNNADVIVAAGGDGSVNEVGVPSTAASIT